MRLTFVATAGADAKAICFDTEAMLSPDGRGFKCSVASSEAVATVSLSDESPSEESPLYCCKARIPDMADSLLRFDQ